MSVRRCQQEVDSPEYCRWRAWFRIHPPTLEFVEAEIEQTPEEVEQAVDSIFAPRVSP